MKMMKKKKIVKPELGLILFFSSSSFLFASRPRQMLTCGSHTDINDINDISMVSSNLATCAVVSDDMQGYTPMSVEDLVNAAPCQLTGSYGTSLAMHKCEGLANQILLCPV